MTVHNSSSIVPAKSRRGTNHANLFGVKNSMREILLFTFLLLCVRARADSSSKLSPILDKTKFGLEKLISRLESISADRQPRANATFYTLCRNEELYDMLEVIQNYEDRFNSKYHYDWVFLNDKPFTTNFANAVSNLVSGDAYFGLVPQEHWSLPSSVGHSSFVDSLEKLSQESTNDLPLDSPYALPIPYANSKSYRHMCRFQSGFFFKHPLLLNYKYYWRVEPDVKLYSDIDYDVFKFMEENSKKYGWAISLFEFRKTIPSLWNATIDYLRATNQESLVKSKENLSAFVYDSDNDDYNLCHFWSNFEIGDMDFFRSETYESFFTHLDSQNGFFYERWGDAPIHSIAAALYMSKDEIHWFKDIAYLHPPYMQCPYEKETRETTKSSCNPASDFTYNVYSCTPWYLKVRNESVPSDEEIAKERDL